MSTLTGRIFAGHLRSIIGSMTVEEIVTERQKLATEVLDGSKAEMAKIGLTVDSLQIQSIDDMNSGYIDAMAAPHNAAIQRQAQIAQAQATQAAAQAQQESQRKQAEYARQTAVVQAQYKAEIDQAQAKAAQAGPLTAGAGPDRRSSTPRPSWPSGGPSCASASWWPRWSSRPRRRRRRSASWPRPTRSGCGSRPRRPPRTTGSRWTGCSSTSCRRSSRRPRAAWPGANVNVLNGAEGLSEIAAGLVGQGLTILDSIKKNLGHRAGGQRRRWSGCRRARRTGRPRTAAAGQPPAAARQLAERS